MRKPLSLKMLSEYAGEYCVSLLSKDFNSKSEAEREVEDKKIQKTAKDIKKFLGFIWNNPK